MSTRTQVKGCITRMPAFLFKSFRECPNVLEFQILSFVVRLYSFQSFITPVFLRGAKEVRRKELCFLYGQGDPHVVKIARKITLAEDSIQQIKSYARNIVLGDSGHCGSE